MISKKTVICISLVLGSSSSIALAADHPHTEHVTHHHHVPKTEQGKTTALKATEVKSSTSALLGVKRPRTEEADKPRQIAQATISLSREVRPIVSVTLQPNPRLEAFANKVMDDTLKWYDKLNPHEICSGLLDTLFSPKHLKESPTKSAFSVFSRDAELSGETAKLCKRVGRESDDESSNAEQNSASSPTSPISTADVASPPISLASKPQLPIVKQPELSTTKKWTESAVSELVDRLREKCEDKSEDTKQQAPTASSPTSSISTVKVALSPTSLASKPHPPIEQQHELSTTKKSLPPMPRTLDPLQQELVEQSEKSSGLSTLISQKYVEYSSLEKKYSEVLGRLTPFHFQTNSAIIQKEIEEIKNNSARDMKVLDELNKQIAAKAEEIDTALSFAQSEKDHGLIAAP